MAPAAPAPSPPGRRACRGRSARPLATLCLLTALLATEVRAAGPLAVAQVYRDTLGGLYVAYDVGGWTFARNGRDLYVSGSDATNTAGLLAHLSLDPASGALAFVDAVRDPFGWPVVFGGLGGATAMAPDEAHLYYTALGTTAVFRRDPAGGGLALLQALELPASAAAGPDAIAMDPEGRQVLVAAGDAVAVYPRAADGSLGAPTLVPLLERDAGDVYTRPASLARLHVSRDGRFLYALAAESDVAGNGSAVIVLRRDPATGALARVQRIADGFDDWATLGSFRGLAPSGDGGTLYTADDYDGGLVALTLDADGGRAVHARVAGREDARSSTVVAVSPDDGLVYAQTGGTNTLDVWHREATTGRLERVQRLEHGEGGAGLDGIEVVASSPDGRFVFVLDSQSHTITVLRRRCGDGAVEPGEACDDGNLARGDGCDAACRVEPCFSCAGAPSACVPAGGRCDDGDPCTAGDACAGGRCAGTTVADGTPCDDGNGCTTGDACRSGACTPSGRIACGACAACDRDTAERLGVEEACVGVLERGCLQPAQILVGDGRHPAVVRPTVGRFSPGRRALRVAWRRDDAASAAGVGDPTDGTGYTLCLLDLDGQERVHPHPRQRRRVVVEARVPPAAECRAASCWQRDDAGALVYRSARGRPDGVRTLRLGRTAGGGLALRATAAGRAFAVSRLRPRVGPITLQVVADGGACWQGELAGPKRRPRP